MTGKHTTPNYLVHLVDQPHNLVSIVLPHRYDYASDTERLAAVRRCATSRLGSGLAVVRSRGAGNVVLRYEHAAL